MKEFVKQRIVGDYKISVYYDEYAQSPCDDWDLAGNFYYEFPRGGLGGHAKRDGYERKDINDILRGLVLTHVSKKEIFETLKKGYSCSRDISGHERFLEYDRHDKVWYLMVPSKDWKTGKIKYLRDNDYGYTKKEIIDEGYIENYIEDLDNDNLISMLDSAKDVVVYEWSSTGYCQGDYVEGIAYMTREQFDERCGAETDDWKQSAIKCMENEAEDIGRWLWGDVYYFSLEKKTISEVKKHYPNGDKPDLSYEEEEWDVIESCGGFFMEPEDIIKAVLSDYGIEQST